MSVAGADSTWILDRHAAAIQSLAAVLSLAVTILLAIITWRYVKLTAAIAATNLEALKLQREGGDRSERQLDGLLTMIEQRLSVLPHEQAHLESVRGAALWTEADLSILQQLAAEEGRDPGSEVAMLVARLRWLSERTAEVKATPPSKGVDWPQFPYHRWLEELTKARSAIPRIQLDLMNVRRGFKNR